MRFEILVLVGLALIASCETNAQEVQDSVDDQFAELQAAKQTAREALERHEAIKAGLDVLSAQTPDSPHLELLRTMVEEQRAEMEKRLRVVEELSQQSESVDLSDLPGVRWQLEFDDSGLLPSNKSEWEGTAAPQEWVSQYLKERYPESYEALEWGEYKVLEDGSFDIWHKYRAKNESGDLVTKDLHFICDEEGHILESYKWVVRVTP